MTADQIEISLALGNLRFLPGSFDNRFAHNVAARAKAEPGKVLTESQNEWLLRILYKYRGQLPALYQKHKNNPHCSQKPKRQQNASNKD